MNTASLPIAPTSDATRYPDVDHPLAVSTEAAPVSGVGVAAEQDQRLAALVDELTDRDSRTVERIEARRPGLWLAVMTASAVVLAYVAVVVAVAPPL